MRDEGEPEVVIAATPDASADDEVPQRAFRRQLPFGRAAVLMVGERAHIVGVADVSVTGAFISTRAPVSVGEAHLLKLLLMPERVELGVRVEIVRVAQASGESHHHPPGVAVRFLDVDEEGRRCLEVFVTRELKSRPS